MPIRYKPGCRTCALSRGNPKLRARIASAFFEREQYGESVKTIAAEIEVSQGAMYNHCKKHITFGAAKAPTLVNNNVEKMKAKLAKEMELAVDHDKILPQKDYEQALTTIIAEGMNELKKGGKTITVSQLIAASKIKGEFETKKRGQDAELLKMMMRSASGLPGVPSGIPGTSPASQPTEVG